MTLTLERAVRASGGRLLNQEMFPSYLRVVTDTRTLEPGDTFLALRGEHFDGHDYVRDALGRGAVAVVVDNPRAVPDNVAALLVTDTKRAYMDLASAAREQFAGHVIAITGSAGKTTTKHLLAQLLRAHYGDASVLASPANENNEIGVSKLLLCASSDHRVLVVEMGARHEGDISQLVQIARPHVGVLTNIGEAHLEIFGSREKLAATKWALFSLGAQAILNARDRESITRSTTLAAAPVWFGAGEPTVPGVWIRDQHTILMTIDGSVREISIDLRLPGAHNQLNLAAAFAAATTCEIEPEELAASIPSLSLPEGRYQTVALDNGARVIYDAYNANLMGMLAALDAFAAERAKKRIAVLSSMAELGADAPAMHERVGAHAAAAGVDILLTGGDYADSIVAGALAAGFSRDCVVRYAGNEDAVRVLRERVQPGDAILLKGSRKYKMEEILEGLAR